MLSLKYFEANKTCWHIQIVHSYVGELERIICIPKCLLERFLVVLLEQISIFQGHVNK